MDRLEVLGVSGHQDPEDEAPWAMQLVVRAEKSALPAAHDVLEASAAAVVRLLDDDRAKDPEMWAPQIERWLAGRIRKVVRRGRGTSWDRTADLDHVEVVSGSAQVRAFVPGPTDAVPAELAKLQVRGLELPLDVPETAESSGLVVHLNPFVSATTGKLAAQVGHAANVAWLEMPTDRLAEWRRDGFGVRVAAPAQASWSAVVSSAEVRITDAGFTEVDPGTMTCVASWTR